MIDRYFARVKVTGDGSDDASRPGPRKSGCSTSKSARKKSRAAVAREPAKVGGARGSSGNVAQHNRRQHSSNVVAQHNRRQHSSNVTRKSDGGAGDHGKKRGGAGRLGVTDESGRRVRHKKKRKDVDDDGGGGFGGGGGGGSGGGGDDGSEGVEFSLFRREFAAPESLRQKTVILPATLRTLSDSSQNLRFQGVHCTFECVAQLLAMRSESYQTIVTLDDSTAVAQMTLDPTLVSTLESECAATAASSEPPHKRRRAGDANDVVGAPDKSRHKRPDMAPSGDGSGDGDGQQRRKSGGRGDCRGDKKGFATSSGVPAVRISGAPSGDKRRERTDVPGRGGDAVGSESDGTLGETETTSDKKTRSFFVLHRYYVVHGTLMPRTGVLAVRTMRRVTDANQITYGALHALKAHLLWLRSPEYSTNRVLSTAVVLEHKTPLASFEMLRTHRRDRPKPDPGSITDNSSPAAAAATDIFNSDRVPQISGAPPLSHD